MLCIPKSNHRKLIDECYPPPKNLASIGPEFKPNSNELSRLAYYGNRKPEKLTKVAKVLEQRAATEAKGISGSGPSADKAKGALMVTLGIVKELITECHRNINYFAPSAASVINSALQHAAKANAGRRDLDVTARSAATFYALANYLNAKSNPIDSETSKQYLSLLSQFAKIAVEQGTDEDSQNRIRLLGVGALAGAIGSDAFFTPLYGQQLSSIAPALLANVDANTFQQGHLQEEADKLAESGQSSNAEYTAKCDSVNARTVPSFSTDAEKPVSKQDLTSAAMGNLHAAVHNGDASHVQGFIGVLVDFLNGKNAFGRQWKNKDWCCWITQSIASWTALQYRFIVPSTLVEYLIDDVDSPVDEKHHTLIAIISSLLGGKLSMIGLSTSDTANNLLGFAVRRVHNDVKDPLLPALVGAIGALGTHVYYADQLNDLAEEITARIAAIEVPQSSSEGGSVTAYTDRKEAKESIRMLLGCLIRLMSTAQNSSGAVQRGATKGQANEVSVTQAGTRSRISVSVFHQTASLLTSPDNWVRQSFEEAILAFLSTEVQPASLKAGEPGSDSLGSKLSVEATGFVHAFSAAMYILTTSKVLYAPSTHADNPLEALPIIERSNKERKLDNSDPTAAGLPIDYSALVQILTHLIERIPVATILGIVPALLAMNKSAASLDPARRNAVELVVRNALSTIGDTCDVSSLRSNQSTSSLPAFPPTSNARPQTFADMNDSSSSGGSIRADSVISSLAGSGKLQGATGLDSKALQNWFGRDWSVQIAVDDSYVGASPFNTVADDEAPLTSSRFATPAVDRAANASSATEGQVTASEGSGVGVDDFRLALGSRSYGKADYPPLSSAPSGTLNGSISDVNGAVNGLDKRASRRASRKISQPMKVTSNGHAKNTVGGLLDSMHVGLAEEEVNAVKVANGHGAAPYVP